MATLLTSSDSPPTTRALPWVSVAITLAAASVPLADVRVADALIFDRARILHGEVWRLWTGHLVHFSASHLAWNLLVFAPAGVWLERLAPRPARLLLALAPGAIGLTLLFGDPALARYGGLSGLAAGVVALLALIQLRGAGTDRWFWRSVLALLGAKVALEFALTHPLFARFSTDAIRPTPLAHLAGVACALILAFVRRPRAVRENA